MNLRRRALASALAAGACAYLQPIEAGLCGNLIIEAGEDCDGDDAFGVCRTPLQPDSCRYDCSGTQSCPPDFVCGAGLVCRTPGVCGNGVTEPEAGEHCDGESSLGVCRPANQPGACRFDCTTANCPAGFECTEVGLCTDQDVCGNGILEEGEDCDGPSTPEGAACRSPGSEGQCRFDCSGNTPCPVGFGCGIDDVCRAPAGTFGIGDPQLGETLGLALGDFDDDDHGELVQVSIDGFHIRQLSSLTSAGTVVPAVPAPPIVGDVDGDGTDDLAFRIPSKFVSGAGELAVFLSNADGELAPLIQYTENLPGFGAALDVLPPAVNSDLVFVNQVQAHGYSFEADVAAVTPVVTFGLTSLLYNGFPQSSAQLLGVDAADFRRNALAPCDELAIAWRNQGSATVITPCVAQQLPQMPPWNAQVIAPTVVVFPTGHVPWAVASTGPNPGGAVFAGDVNGDGVPDLLIPTDSPPPLCALNGCTAPDITQCQCHGCNDNGICGALEDCVCNDCAGDLACNYPGVDCDVDGQCEPGSEGCGCPDCAAHPSCPGPKSLQVSYGVGDGSFHSVLPVPPGSGDNKTSSIVYDRLPNFQCPDQRGPLASELLAVADLNEDSLVDLVTGHGIYVTLPTGALAYTFCPQDPWKEAVVADLDGNGTLDVFAKSGTTTLQYLNGVGDGTFSSQAIAAGGFPFGLVAADIDGDTLGDVAFLRTDVPGPSATGLRDVMVAFGRPFAAPAQPVVVGRARDAHRLLAGRMLFGDGAAELVVQRPAGGANTAVVRGGVARQLVSPLVLRSGTALPAFATHEQVTSLETLVYGNFRIDHSAHFVFAAMSARFGADHRVELISSEDGEQLVHWHTAPFDCQAPAGPCAPWRLGAMDLDNDQVDSVVAFRDDEIVVFTETTAPQIAQRFDTGFDLFKGTRGDVHAEMVGRPLVVDIDADGLEDVAVLGSVGEIHILWNDGGGQLSMDRHTVVASGEPFLAFAFLQTQGDDRLELATVGAQGIELRSLDTDDEFGPPLAMVDGPVGDILVAGDFSGDGVDDMVLGDALSFTLMFGDSVEP